MASVIQLQPKVCVSTFKLATLESSLQFHQVRPCSIMIQSNLSYSGRLIVNDSIACFQQYNHGSSCFGVCGATEFRQDISYNALGLESLSALYHRRLGTFHIHFQQANRQFMTVVQPALTLTTEDLIAVSLDIA